MKKLRTWDEVIEKIHQGEKINLECKLAAGGVPRSVYETYSSFANTHGGMMVLGVEERRHEMSPEERFVVCGVENPEKLREDFWNTINSQRVSANILVDDDVYVVEQDGVFLLVIEVPRADYTMRPVYVGENPLKGTLKRNHEGDYHAKGYEVRAMIRDQSSEGNDSTILEGEGLTVAGLMMFGTGIAIRDEFDNIFMDYRDE
ncbi:MAG: ATP-binding protein, partial [Clostridiales bacterium]|nr:ATP-binding protein [Clostridiales bacterium]